MKILHITDAAAGGVLSSVTTLARSQSTDSRFDEVGFCYTPRTDSPRHEDIANGMGQCVMVERWSQTPTAGFNGLVRGLIRELRSDHWDVIHLHSSRAGFLARSLAVLLRPRAHLVYSPHGFSFNQIKFSPRKRGLFLALERMALRGGRDLVLVSGTEAECAAQQLPRARAFVLANAVDTATFAPPSAHAEPDEEPLKVVHLGRVAPQKNPGQFAQIASMAHQEHPGRFTFTWIGEGNRRLLEVDPDTVGGPSCSAPAPAVSVTGWITSKQIREHLADASILLFTSAAEGMPISMLEAGSMAIPTVGADVIGVRDLIADGVDGFLFRTSDEAVAALGDLLPEDRRRVFGAAARARVVREHSQADLAERSLSIYTGFIGSEPVRRRGRDPEQTRPATTGTASHTTTTTVHTTTMRVHPHVSKTGSRTA